MGTVPVGESLSGHHLNHKRIAGIKPEPEQQDYLHRQRQRLLLPQQQCQSAREQPQEAAAHIPHVLCVDEKTQIQALDRTQPGLPLSEGRIGSRTHDYKRNGTTSLYAAFMPKTTDLHAAGDNASVTEALPAA